jgi:4-amino-4-deoxy-L-arabinose transferase-like glycosyltransferase
MRLSVILLAIAVRVAAVLLLQSHTVPRSTYEHGEIAANLLAGRGFSTRFLGADGPTSQQAPAYPMLVAASYAIGGIETPWALLILELAQSALGGLLVAGVLALAGEVAPGRRGAALAAGLIAALHPTLVYAATHVQVALLAATLLVWTLALCHRTGRSGRHRDAIGAGLTMGLLVLTDPILGLVVPGAAWALASGRGGWRLTGLAALTAVIVVAPWIVRNRIVHGELVFVKSTFGYAFWQGNCALSEGTDKVVRPSIEAKLRASGPGLKGLNESLWAARHEAGYLDDIALTPADYRTLAAVNEPERSRILFRRACIDLRADPWRYPRLCLRRLRYFVLFDETNPKTRNIVYRASHLGLTFLAALGWSLLPREVRRRLLPTALTMVLITAFHALTIVSARFHIPIEPLLGLWAGCGLGRLEQPRPAVSAGAPAPSLRTVGRRPRYSPRPAAWRGG